MRPQRRQPSRLRRPWDSPGKNTGVGSHLLLQCTKVKSKSEVAQSRLTGASGIYLSIYLSFPGGASGNEPACQCKSLKRHKFDPWVRKISWRKAWQPIPVFFLENSMYRGAWWATVHGVTKSWTQMSDFTFTFHFHALEKEMATHSSVLAWRIPGTKEA